MTASYAMRNHPKIPPGTRGRIQRIAKKIGYVPNPEISRLMQLLRGGRVPSYKATLACLSFYHGPFETAHRYTADVIAGARKRAAELGYSVDVLSIEHSKLGSERLTAMLKSRAIRGVLIPPLSEVVDCSRMLDWSQFSIIAATSSTQNLFVNRVIPHHQDNIMQALLHLRKLGYRKLGLVLTRDLTHRVNFAYQAALALHQQAGDFVPIPALNLASSDYQASGPAMRAWLGAYRPEVLLTIENVLPALVRTLGPRYPAKTGICLLDHSGIGPMAGVHQHPALIGETAVELLAGQVEHGELGFGSHPRVTMVEGRWIEGTSV
jgi:DNA-binding LacI/PurR family transcriptional regulator